MVQGFLLDRIDVHGDRAAVDEAPKLAAHVHPGAAAAAPAGFDDAPLGAQEALDEARLVADPFPLQFFPGGMALAAVGARKGDRGPVARPGGGTDQGGERVKGEEKSSLMACEKPLPQGGGEAQPSPAEDRDDPGQRLEEIPSGDHGRLPGCVSEETHWTAAINRGILSLLRGKGKGGLSVSGGIFKQTKVGPF